MAACVGKSCAGCRLGEWHQHLPTLPPALTFHLPAFTNPRPSLTNFGTLDKYYNGQWQRRFCYGKHVYLFILLTSVMMSVASGVDLKEWKTLHLQRVSQQDDGKSLLLEPGELTSWRGDTRHQLERLETARVGRGSTTISQLARPTLQPAHHSRDTAPSRFLYSSSFSQYSDHRILHKQALEERVERRGRESS